MNWWALFLAVAALVGIGACRRVLDREWPAQPIMWRVFLLVDLVAFIVNAWKVVGSLL